MKVHKIPAAILKPEVKEIPLEGRVLKALLSPEPDPVPGKVKSSTFGCMNCLWASIECKSGSLYKPDEKGECSSYTYYD